MNFFSKNLRNPARTCCAGLMRLFRPGQVYSNFLSEITKGDKLKIGNVSMCQYLGSARVRCAIYSRDIAARIYSHVYSVPRFKRNKPFVKIPSWDKVMGFAEYFCRPF
jgi:hypothetical protein